MNKLFFLFFFTFGLFSNICFSQVVVTNQYDSGVAYFKKKQYRKAISLFSETLKFNDTLREVYKWRAICYLEINSYDSAIFDLKKIYSKSDVFTNYNLGNSFVRKKSYDTALFYFRIAASLDSLDSNTNLSLATVYFKLNNYEGARNYVLKYLKTNSQSYYGLQILGFSAQYLNKHNESIDAFSKIIELYPSDTIAYFKRAIQFFILKEYDKAILDLNKVILLNPEYVKAYYFKCLAYVELNNREMACQIYQKVIELDPDSDISRYVNCP